MFVKLITYSLKRLVEGSARDMNEHYEVVLSFIERFCWISCLFKIIFLAKSWRFEKKYEHKLINEM